MRTEISSRKTWHPWNNLVETCGNCLQFRWTMKFRMQDADLSMFFFRGSGSPVGPGFWTPGEVSGTITANNEAIPEGLVPWRNGGVPARHGGHPKLAGWFLWTGKSQAKIRMMILGVPPNFRKPLYHMCWQFTWPYVIMCQAVHGYIKFTSVASFTQHEAQQSISSQQFYPKGWSMYLRHVSTHPTYAPTSCVHQKWIKLEGS